MISLALSSWLPRPSNKYHGCYPLGFEKYLSEWLGTENYVHFFAGMAKTGYRIDINPNVKIECIEGYFSEYFYNGDKDIAVLAFDNMDARLKAVEILCKTQQCPKLIIDGRMGAEHYQQYVIEKPTVQKYKKIWYSNAKMASEPCNMKATTYCSYMSGSFIANSVRKYATKQPFNGDFSFNFPTMMLDKI